jgi:phosphatidylinositol glycan class C protein
VNPKPKKKKDGFPPRDQNVTNYFISYIPIAMYSPVARPFQTSDYQYNPNNPPWQKLLWVKQNYPDNYVDSTFLDELQRNGEPFKKKKAFQTSFNLMCIVNVQTYDYWTMVYESGVITQHISSVVIFIALFIYLQIHSLSGSHLIWTGSLLTGVGYLVWDVIMLKYKQSFEFKREFFYRQEYGNS